MKSIILIFFILISFSVKGQDSADNYFNDGAQMYTHNKLQTAVEIVEKGLDKYPSDRKLNELKKHKSTTCKHILAHNMASRF